MPQAHGAAGKLDGRIVGTVQIGLDTPTNQPDRGKVSKMTAGLVTIGLAMMCFVLSPATKLDTLWMILGLAVISLTVSSLGLVALIRPQRLESRRLRIGRSPAVR